MKLTLLIMVLSFSFSTATGQELNDLNNSARRFLFANTDSSLTYGQRALLVARKTGNVKFEAEANYLLGGNYWIMGDYATALRNILQSLRLNEKLENLIGMADDYRALASIYRDQGDTGNAISYAMRCKALAGPETQVDVNTVIGSIYEKFGKLDSALYFLTEADMKDVKAHGQRHYGYISFELGNVYYKKAKYPLAVTAYRTGIGLMESQHVYKDLMEGDMGLARAYRDMHQPDSAVSYAEKSLATGKSTPFLMSMLDAGTLLYSVYQERKNLDSSLKYANLCLSIKDSLYNQRAAREFQALVFREQLREQDLEQARVRTEEERKENIQMIGIGAFIPVFFMTVLILSRRRLNTKVIDFLVLIGLLLFFEFITLLIHPRLETLTNRKPILMLLSLAAIASILIPSHHRLESWLKKRMANPARK